MDSYLSVAGITIAVRSREEPRWTWEEPVSRFLVPGAASPDVELDVVIGWPGPRTAEEPLFDSDSVWRLYRENAGFRIECSSEAFGDGPYKTAVFDETFTRGTIYVEPHVGHLNPLDYPLDEVLLANLLGRGRGVELHSCGVIDHQGRGHLFVGVSGAGKTTTARLWEGIAAGIVSDDRVIVREVNGEPWMFGTPWHGEAELSMAHGVPLAGVYLLVQAQASAIVELDAGEAVARLFRCAFPLFHDAAALDFTVDFLSRLVHTVPVRELQFTPDRRAVDMVLRGMIETRTLIADLLRRGHAVRFPARGDSMYPLIRDNDELHVEPDQTFRTGDIVLVLADRGLTAHRVIATRGSAIVTRGDNTPAPDGPVTRDRVLGKVTKVFRDGKAVNVKSVAARAYALLRRTLR